MLCLAAIAIDLKGIDGDWSKLFSIIGDCGQILIALGMFYLGWQGHKKISFEEKILIKDHHTRVLDTVEEIRRFIQTSSPIDINYLNPILNLLALSREAKLIISSDICDHIYDNLFVLYNEIVITNKNDPTLWAKEAKAILDLFELYKKHLQMK